MHWPAFNRRYLFAKRSGSAPGCNVSAGCCQQSWEERRKRAFAGLADFQWDTLTSCGYVLAAEVLGTIILIVLCVVAAKTASQMSSDIEAAALTALGRSDPLALCINATDSMQGLVLKTTLTLQADSFQDTEGQVWRKVTGQEDPFGLTESNGIFSFASPANNMERVSFTQTNVLFAQSDNPDAGGNFIRTTIAAMYHCGVITGGYNAEDLPSFTSSQCHQCNIRPQSSVLDVPFHSEFLKDEASVLQVSLALQQLGGEEWSMGSDINQARASQNIEQVAASYTFTLEPLYSSGNMTSTKHQNATNAMAWTDQNLLPGLDFLLPDIHDQNFRDTAVYVTTAAWALALGDMFAPDPTVGPGWAPPLTFRVSVYGRDANKFDDQVQPVKLLSGSAWFQLGQQSLATAECMAKSATMAAHALSALEWTLVAPNGSEIITRPADHNITVRRLYLSIPFDRLLYDAQPYTCVGGVEVSGPDSAAYLSKQTAYRANAKTRYKATMFVSMTDQTYDDVYAIYTGALGAVFGAMALLVATLFVYALALVYCTSRGCNLTENSTL